MVSDTHPDLWWYLSLLDWLEIRCNFFFQKIPFLKYFYLTRELPIPGNPRWSPIPARIFPELLRLPSRALFINKSSPTPITPSPPGNKTEIGPSNLNAPSAGALFPSSEQMRQIISPLRQVSGQLARPSRGFLLRGRPPPPPISRSPPPSATARCDPLPGPFYLAGSLLTRHVARNDEILRLCLLPGRLTVVASRD